MPVQGNVRHFASWVPFRDSQESPMFRIAIRYMGRDKDDVLSATVTNEEALRVRNEIAALNFKSPESSTSFIVIEAEDKKTILIRRETILSVTVWEDRDR